MDTGTTLIIFAAGVVLAVAAIWGDHARRRKPDAALALLPWHALLFLGVALVLLMAAHGLTLLRAS